MDRRKLTNSVTHFKMYKSGRKWVFAGLTAITLLTATGVAHADTTQANNNSATAASVNTTTVNSNSVNAASSATATSSATASASAVVLSASTSASATSSAVASASSAVSASASQAAPASASSATANSASASASQATATSTVKVAAQAASATAAQSSATDLSSLHFSNNAKSQQFIESVAQGAIDGWNQYKVLPSITVAQAILESGWGTSTLATKAHNLFGIKGSYNGNSVTMPTREVYGGRSYYINDNFRAYANNSESITDHGNFLYSNSRYQNLLGDTNYVSVAQKLHADGYATDPSYANSLINLVKTYNLTQLDAVALSGKAVVTKSTNSNSSATTNSQAATNLATATVSGTTNYYTVKSGDTLSKIANSFNTTTSKLAQLNNIKNVNRIYIGQRLLVRQNATSAAPASAQKAATSQSSAAKANNSQSQAANSSQTASTYTVKRGDTLSGIAGHFNTTYTKLAQINHLSNPNHIYIGQVLQLKAQATASTNTSVAAQHNGSATAASASNTKATVSSAASTYTVKSGDTLSQIAERFNTTYTKLAQSNHLTNPNHIYVGQVLQINGTARTTASTSYQSNASQGSYTVKSGDTLSAIAAQHGLSWRTLASKNNIQSPYTIYVGQHLAF